MSAPEEKGLFVIGHVKKDLLPTPHIGGPVTYVSVAARRLGLNPHLITKLPKKHEYLNYLGNLGVMVHNLPLRDSSNEGKITSGKNYFHPDGGKHQELVERQEDIAVDDLASQEFPRIKNGDTVVIAPDIGEVDTRIFEELRKKIGDKGFLAISPSGYFRHVEEDGTVRKGPWDGIDALQYADLVILSEDDLVFDSEEQLERIRSRSPIAILTQGGKGLTIFGNDEKEHIHPFILDAGELKDFDGAGDATIASFLWRYRKSGDVKESGAFGALYSALKIKGVGGSERGIMALPTLSQVQEFTKENYGRVNEFYEGNGLSIPSFLVGNGHHTERR